MKPQLWRCIVTSTLLMFLSGCTESTRDIAVHAESLAGRALFISIAVPVLSLLAVIVLVTRKPGKRKEDDDGPKID
jgi:hypothetical protein